MYQIPITTMLKTPQIQELNSKPLNVQGGVKEKNHSAHQKIFEFNDNENVAYQNLWKTVKAMLQGSFRAKLDITDIDIYLQKLEKKNLQRKQV